MDPFWLELLVGLTGVLAGAFVAGSAVTLVIMRITEGHWFPRRDCNCRGR